MGWHSKNLFQVILLVLFYFLCLKYLVPV
jgi:hypothetical protein